MTLEYFKKQIKDELEWAKDYIDKAIEAKVSHPEWSCTFCSMSEMEISHAEHLLSMLKMFIRDMNKTVTNTPSTLAPEETFKECMKEYAETKNYVCNMKRGL